MPIMLGVSTKRCSLLYTILCGSISAFNAAYSFKHEDQNGKINIIETICVSLLSKQSHGYCTNVHRKMASCRLVSNTSASRTANWGNCRIPVGQPRRNRKQRILAPDICARTEPRMSWWTFHPVGERPRPRDREVWRYPAPIPPRRTPLPDGLCSLLPSWPRCSPGSPWSRRWWPGTRCHRASSRRNRVLECPCRKDKWKRSSDILVNEEITRDRDFERASYWLWQSIGDPLKQSLPRSLLPFLAADALPLAGRGPLSTETLQATLTTPRVSKIFQSSGVLLDLEKRAISRARTAINQVEGRGEKREKIHKRKD